MRSEDLKAEFIRNGYTQKDVAGRLGITARTLNNKLKSGIFTNKEMEILIAVLNISDISIFFNSKEKSKGEGLNDKD